MWSSFTGKFQALQFHKVPLKPYVSRVSRLIKGQIKGQRAAKNPVTVEITGFSLAQKEGFEPSRRV